jgi:hypothetical protein
VELPCRVLKKDFEKSPYLLKLREHDVTDEYLNRLFVNRQCKECSNSFRRIDLYNDHNEQYKGVFHKAIRNTKLSDWEFSVLEIIGESPEGISTEEYVLSRETHWMKKYDSIDNGYNSQISSITVHGHLEESRW